MLIPSKLLAIRIPREVGERLGRLRMVAGVEWLDATERLTLDSPVGRLKRGCLRIQRR